MYMFLPYMTNDYSIGLYNENVDDIYHSAFGALNEAYEKFVSPAIENISLDKKNEINVLDICYGIGYNTKVLINEVRNKYPDLKIKIDCVDTDRTLMELSPFILSNVNLINRLIHKNKLLKNAKRYSETKKIVELKNKSQTNKISKSVNKILLKNLISCFGLDFLSKDSIKILQNRENDDFFDNSLLNFYKIFLKNRIYLHQNKNKSTFVHNIYYKYVSRRYKYLNDLSLKYTINFIVSDIRRYLIQTDRKYDLIFLDGFTPSKCPCIWSVDIFKELYNHLNNDGVLLTYNKSAPVRKAMIDNKFYIGNTVSDKNKLIGTIASKKISNIKNKLSDKDFGLLSTKAGIPYRDINLSLDNNIIKANREKEVAESLLLSSTQYIKGLKNEI